MLTLPDFFSSCLAYVFEHGVDLLKDPEGVLDIDVVGIPHVVPAEGVLLDAC